MLLDKNLIWTQETFENQEDCLRTIATRIVDFGYAKPTYPQAIIDREKMYPTGLPAAAFDIAIAHCDTQYVNKPAISLTTLTKPVQFQMMGGGDTLHPKLIFMLAIKDSKAQIETLKALMNVIQNKELLEQVYASQTADEIYNLLVPVLNV